MGMNKIEDSEKQGIAKKPSKKPTVRILPQQLKLSDKIPTVLGNVDYQRLEGNLAQMDRILRESGVEDELVKKDSEKFMSGYEGWSQGKREGRERLLGSRQRHARLALRVNVLRKMMGLTARGMSQQLAMSPMLRIFCGVEMIGEVKVPAKSTVDRYGKWYGEYLLRWAFEKLLSASSGGEGVLGDGAVLDTSVIVVDSTCLESDVHYPVDWVLLKDAAASLMQSIEVIRKHGLVHRMKEPAGFVSRMNKHCIAMSQAGKRGGDKAACKKIFRKMKKLLKVVEAHARRYRGMLDSDWGETGLSRKEAEVILARMDRVLGQIPDIVHQAHERIIGGRPVENSEKILSLFDRDIHVINRGKAGAEVEFGNPLFIVEQSDGMLVDFELVRGAHPGDAAWLKARMGHLRRLQGPVGTIHCINADRGFDSKAIRKELEAINAFNAIQPKTEPPLRDEIEEEVFRACQKRRAQIEGRIGIFKRCFLDAPASSKGFDNRNREVAMAAFTHNLWLLGRIRFDKELLKHYQREQERDKARKAGRAA